MKRLDGPLRKVALAMSVLSLLLAATAAHAGSEWRSPREAEASENVSIVRSFKFPSGNEIDAQGDYVYVGQWEWPKTGGIHIFDVSQKVPRRVGFTECRGFPNDVEVVRPGLIAVGIEYGTCGRLEDQPGIQLIDVRNPGRPKYLGALEIGAGLHTISAHPGGRFVYVSPGSGLDRPGIEKIVDVSDPLDLKVSATYEFTPSGCHDVQFYVFDRRQLGFCPGEGGTQIWDVSDPVAPQLIAFIALPALELPHSVAVSSDGKLAAISQEDWVAHECAPVGGPTGGLWLYDISTLEQPRLVGYYKTPRGRTPVGSFPTFHSCTAHNNMFVPGTKLLLTTWYAAGTSVLDVGDPVRPKEIAYFHPENANALSAYWYRGRAFVADMNRGLDVLKIAFPAK